MTTFKRIVTKHGRTQYWVNGKMTKQEQISEDILHRLETEPEFETTDSRPTFGAVTMNTKICVFDGNDATHQKFVLGNMYGLCAEDYFGRTTGQLVQAIKHHEAQLNQTAAG